MNAPHRIMISLGVVFLVLVVAGRAMSGLSYKGGITVHTSEDTIWVSGTVAGTLISSNNQEFLHCGTSAGKNSAAAYGTCASRDKDGHYRVCYTSNAAMLDVMQSVGPASYIFITYKIGDAYCDSVHVINGSPYAHY